MITLALDASTYAGDVAVVENGTVLAEIGVAMKGADHERLMPAVEQCLVAAGVDRRALDRIVCGAGPGSFTSLRIAGAIAKGLATGLVRPLYAVPSMAMTVGGAGLPTGRYATVVDALRGEAYVGLLEVAGDRAVHELERPRVVAMPSVVALASEWRARTVGSLGVGPDLEAVPRARGIVFLEEMLNARGPVDVGSWEPQYGRLAEAQVKWEAAHGQPLPAS